jgi:hypothetical protein
MIITNMLIEYDLGVRRRFNGVLCYCPYVYGHERNVDHGRGGSLDVSDTLHGCMI